MSRRAGLLIEGCFNTLWVTKATGLLASYCIQLTSRSLIQIKSKNGLCQFVLHACSMNFALALDCGVRKTFTGLVRTCT